MEWPCSRCQKSERRNYFGEEFEFKSIKVEHALVLHPEANLVVIRV